MKKRNLVYYLIYIQDAPFHQFVDKIKLKPRFRGIGNC